MRRLNKSIVNVNQTGTEMAEHFELEINERNFNIEKHIDFDLWISMRTSKLVQILNEARNKTKLEKFLLIGQSLCSTKWESKQKRKTVWFK